MHPLPVISCDGCGVCCSHIGNPPFMGFEVYDLPEDLRDEMLRVSAAREEMALPCLWLDQTTKKCSHYEHRPSVCRDYEMGGPACLLMREATGIDRPLR
jgi:Fe-S-cluster containining protein